MNITKRETHLWLLFCGFVLTVLTALLLLVAGASFVFAANNPDIVVEWHPNSGHINPAREGKGVYPLTINGIRGATKVGIRAVLWLPAHVPCDVIEDTHYRGEKVLHLFIDAMSVPQCQGYRYAHFDVPGGYCQSPDRLQWNVALPAVRKPGADFPAAMLWWMAVKAEPLRGTNAHFSLTQTWAAADDPEISYTVGDGETMGAQEFSEPMFMDCRNVFP